MNIGLFFRTLFRRELISQKTYSLQVVLSVMIGVGAVTGIQSYKSSLMGLIHSESRNIMGADLAFQTPERIRPFQIELMDATLPNNSQRAEVIQFLSMIQSKLGGESALSTIRAIEPGYPFYGTVETDPADAYKNLDDQSILMDLNLSKNLKLKLGDDVQLGDKIFSFKGVLVKEPGSLGGFTGMAPISIVRKSSLDKAGLEERGSRIRYTIFAKLPEEYDSELFKEQFFDNYMENDLTIFHNTETNSGSQLFITNTLDFLSLLGLGSLFLGTIAIFISTRTRVTNSEKQISILKCLGVKSFHIKILVLSETLILSIIGVILGIIVGYWIQSELPNLLRSDYSHLSLGLTRIAIIEGLGLGLIIPSLVSIHSLVKASNISPMDALKNPDGIALDDSNLNRKFGTMEFILIGIVFLMFLSISIIDTGSIKKGLLLGGVFFLIPLLVWFLYIALRSILVACSKIIEFPRTISIVFKKFIRQYNLISLSVIGLGSAIFVLMLSLILRESLLNLGGARLLTKRPNIFVMDIRNDQRQEFESIVLKKSVQEYNMVPIYRARLDKINGTKVDKAYQKKEAKDRDWRSQARTREYMLSFRDNLYNSESIKAGKFWNKSSINEISVEKDFAKYLEAGVGDELEFKLEGFPMDSIKGKITNLRSVNWSDMKPNFVVLFSRGSLEDIPGFYISSFYLESDSDRYLLQKELVSKFPNLTYIDTEKAVKSFEGLVEKVSDIINLMSILLVFASIMLLVSVLYSSSRDRLKELVFYRVLGARKNFVRSLVIQEGLFLGLFSFISGFGLALIADFIINFYLLELESVYPAINIWIVFIVVICAVLASYVASTYKLFNLPVKRLMKI